MKKWKCTVCGYVHTADEPPEKCPVCGADSSKFVLLDEMATSVAVESKTGPTNRDSAVGPEGAGPNGHVGTGKPLNGLYQRLGPLLTRLHAHPVCVHLPNGVLPVGLAFLLVGALFNCTGLVQAGFYNLVVVLLAMPAVLFTGYNDWKQRYGGHLTPLFVTKIACGAVVGFGCLALVLWLIARPDLLVTASISRRVFAFFGLVTLAAAVIAGYCGGKLIFFYQVPKKDTELDG